MNGFRDRIGIFRYWWKSSTHHTAACIDGSSSIHQVSQSKISLSHIKIVLGFQHLEKVGGITTGKIVVVTGMPVRAVMVSSPIRIESVGRKVLKIQFQPCILTGGGRQGGHV